MNGQAVKMDFIPWAQPYIQAKEREYLARALDSTWVSGGEFVNGFEKAFAEYHRKKFALSTSNGTTSLLAAFLALKLGAGDEIILPGYCFLAAAHMAMHLGAKPVFAEVEPDTWCLSARAIEEKITTRTKLVVPVHTYGNICDMEPILSLAREHDLIVLEDAAEAFASRYKDCPAGSMGWAGSFSFQATKTITTGEGGMVVTDNEELFKGMGLYRNHGMVSGTYFHEVAGHNFRLTNLQAAVGCAQLENLEEIIHQRRHIGELYDSLLAEAPGIALQRFDKAVERVLWTCALRLDPEAFPQGRDQVIGQLRERNIETRRGFVAPSLMPLYGCPPLPICEQISRQVLCLPTYPGLTDEQIEYASKVLLEIRR